MDVGKIFFFEFQFVDALLDECFAVAGVEDCEIFRETSRDFDFASQKSRTEGMERAEPNIAGRRAD